MATPKGFEPLFLGGKPNVLSQLDDRVIFARKNYIQSKLIAH